MAFQPPWFTPPNYSTVNLIDLGSQQFATPEVHDARRELVVAYEGFQYFDEIDPLVAEYSGRIATAAVDFDAYLRDEYKDDERAADVLGPEFEAELVNGVLVAILKAERIRRLETAERQFVLPRKEGMQRKINLRMGTEGRVWKNGFLDTMAKIEKIGRAADRDFILDSLTINDLVTFRREHLPDRLDKVPQAIDTVVPEQVQQELNAYAEASKLYAARNG